MKFSSKHWITLVTTSLLCTSVLMAKPLDISQQEKDMRIMRGIITSSLEESKEDFPGRPNVKSTYLADQGYLFTIRLNGLSGFGIPGVAGWDGGRLELDIPEIIEEAFNAIDYDDVVAPTPPEAPDVVDAITSEFGYKQSEESRELQQKLRELREEQRDLRRETYDLSRDVRRAKEAEERKAIESKLAKTKAELQQKKEAYNKMLGNYKTERLSKQIRRSDKAINAIMETICDYGQTMRSMKKNEKLNLLIQGGVTADGERESQMYIFNQKDIRDCRDANKLKKQATYYTL